jgi:CMP-N,N'-diacetyllegionaminic acid synthase
MNSLIALIPARLGSKRVPGKNVRPLAGHPLIAYTIQAAIDSAIFDTIIVSTDSLEYSEISEYYGALVPWLRPQWLAVDVSPDIEWIQWTLDRIGEIDKLPDHYMILRPTSPFRTGDTIKRAWAEYRDREWMKAISPVHEHPMKMWIVAGAFMFPFHAGRPMYHMQPTQNLQPIYVQNGSLEIRPTGDMPPSTWQPFMTEGYEGHDVNIESDWIYAERLVAQGKATLPMINIPPYCKGFNEECPW